MSDEYEILVRQGSLFPCLVPAANTRDNNSSGQLWLLILSDRELDRETDFLAARVLDDGLLAGVWTCGFWDGVCFKNLSRAWRGLKWGWRRTLGVVELGSTEVMVIILRDILECLSRNRDCARICSIASFGSATNFLSWMRSLSVFWGDPSDTFFQWDGRE